MEENPLAMFRYAIKSEQTRQKYERRLEIFFDHIGLEGDLESRCKSFVEKASVDNKWAFSSLMKFMTYQKERASKQEISEATVGNYYKPIKLFCEMSDIVLPWTKVTRGLPRGRKHSNDRIPTLDEVRAITNYPDRRIKAIVYTMISSGIRIGAWDYLKWGHLNPIERDGVVVAARMHVYAGDKEQYLTFVSAEAYNAIKEWMDFRQRAGEAISKDSWVMRNLFNMEENDIVSIRYPKKLKSTGIKRIIERALWTQGVRKPLTEGQRRHDFKASHSFRKFFKTRSEQAMKPINVEWLMGHSTGISDSYYRPTEQELLEDYLKAISLLQISEISQARHESQEHKENFEHKLEEMKAVVTGLQNQLTLVTSSILSARIQAAQE